MVELKGRAIGFGVVVVLVSIVVGLGRCDGGGLSSIHILPLEVVDIIHNNRTSICGSRGNGVADQVVFGKARSARFRRPRFQMLPIQSNTDNDENNVVALGQDKTSWTAVGGGSCSRAIALLLWLDDDE